MAAEGFEAVVEEGGILAHQHGDAQGPGEPRKYEVGIGERGEEEDGSGGHQAAEQERELAPPAVGHGAGGDLKGHDAYPEDGLQDGDLGERQVALVLEEDHPDGPPELEVDDGDVGVELPDVGPIGAGGSGR